ncbi:hypothetical protein [Sciscionella sediminilitoris]|uniref:hypothetical protein n=1 Tax=Sciscionella sediminilitoris TaxID=1445613 RepID=UPI0012E129D4|nr:hypothetical protein [Sciscionella sp. SE31]
MNEEPGCAEWRAALRRDRELLAELDPRSDEYRRVRRRIRRETAKLAGYEEIRARRGAERGYAGWALAVIGAVVLIPAWGTWWILLGLGMLLFGLYLAVERPRPR